MDPQTLAVEGSLAEGIDWNSAPEFGRRVTLLRALRRLQELKPRPCCVVETGTLRNDSPSGCSGDGWSTLAWGWYCSQTGGTAYTVDIDGNALQTCRRLTAPYAAHLHYIESDSVAFLRQWRERSQPPIDLCYLDSFDYVDKERSEAHHLAEAEAILPSLAPLCLVLFDDTSPVSETDYNEARGDEGRGDEAHVERPSFSGKGARAIPFFLEHGFQVEWAEGGQVLLSRGAPADPDLPAGCPSSASTEEPSSAIGEATAKPMTAKGTGMRVGTVEITYCNGSHNGAGNNERTVEVPLGFDFVGRFESESLVEVGAVLPYYGPISHRVIDLFDRHPQALREDAARFNFLGCNVLSISTVEHMGRPDYGNQTVDDDLAFRCLSRMVAEARSYLITFPIGYHAALDRQVQESPFPHLILTRDAFNNWSVHPEASDFSFRYNSPYNNGNALCLLTNLPNYFDDNT